MANPIDQQNAEKKALNLNKSIQKDNESIAKNLARNNAELTYSLDAITAKIQSLEKTANKDNNNNEKLIKEQIDILKKTQKDQIKAKKALDSYMKSAEEKGSKFNKKTLKIIEDTNQIALDQEKARIKREDKKQKLLEKEKLKDARRAFNATKGKDQIFLSTLDKMAKSLKGSYLKDNNGDKREWSKEDKKRGYLKRESSRDYSGMLGDFKHFQDSFTDSINAVVNPFRKMSKIKISSNKISNNNSKVSALIDKYKTDNSNNKPSSKNDTQSKVAKKEIRDEQNQTQQLASNQNDLLFSIDSNIKLLVTKSDIKTDDTKKQENIIANGFEKAEKKKSKGLGLGSLLMAGGLISAVLSGNWSPFLKTTLRMGARATSVFTGMFNNIFKLINAGKDVAKDAAKSTSKNIAKGAAKSTSKNIAKDAAKSTSKNIVKNNSKSLLGKSIDVTKGLSSNIAGDIKSTGSKVTDVAKSFGSNIIGGAKKLGKSAIEKIPKLGDFIKTLKGWIQVGGKKVMNFASNFLFKRGMLSKGEDISKLMGKKAAKKTSERAGFKMIPGLGAAISAGGAITRIMKGDYVGAGLELASGGLDVLGMVSAPETFGAGLGASWAAQVPIIGAQIAHDIMSGDKYKKKKSTENNKPGLISRVFGKKDKSQTGDSNISDANPFKKEQVNIPKKKSMVNYTGSPQKEKKKKSFFGNLLSKAKDILTKKDMAENIIPNSDNLDFGGVLPGAWNNLQGLAEDYKRSNPDKPNIFLNSAFRSYEDQVRLYKQYGAGRAATPGTSHHGFGYAFDMNSAEMNIAENQGLLSKWGFHRPVKGEPWHVESIGAKDNPGRDSKVKPKPAKQQIGDSNLFKPMKVDVNNNNSQFNTTANRTANTITVVALDQKTIKSLLDGQANIAKSNKIKVKSTPAININGRM